VTATATGKPGTREPVLALALQRGARIASWPVSTARLRRWARMAISRDATLTLRLVGRAEAVALNQAYRRRDYAPNVLTFAYGEPAPGSPVEADVVICVPVVRAEARAQRKPFDHHLAHMVVHGVLHAQGHDHIRADEAARMEALETRLLARLRIPDPYAVSDP
jgi:probable rRNA maturation factor